MAAIDIMENPATNGDNQDENSNNGSGVSLLSRGLQGFNRGVAGLPDLASNFTSKIGAYLTGSKEPLWQLNPVENAFEKLGIINSNMPAAQGYGERAIEKGGEMLGGMAIPIGGAIKGTYEGAGALTQALAKALLGNKAATAGSIVAPALASPVIEDYTKDPLTRAGLELGTSLAGGIGGGLLSKSLGGSTSTLPELTAAQRVPPDSPEAATLLSRQNSLLNTDQKSANAASQMLNNQRQSIADSLQAQNPTTGDEIASQINDKFDQLVAQRRADHDTASDKIFSDNQRNPVNVDDTVSALGDAQAGIAKMGGGKSTSLESAINDAMNLVVNNAHDPVLLKGALHEIQQMTKPTGPLQLSSQQSAVLQPAINSLRSDINRSNPGFADLQSNYANQTQDLNDLKDGIVGKIAKKADLNPAQVFQNIFEKTDPARTQEIQDVLGPDLYNQAADTHLQMLGNKALTPSTADISNNNPSPQLMKLGDALRSKQSTLNNTLPDAQKQLVQSLIDKTEQSTRGIPAGNFAANAAATPNNPISALGDYNKGILPYAIDVLKNTGIKQGINALQRNEMLGYGSPSSQIGTGLTSLGIKGIGVNAMNPPPMMPTVPDQQTQTAPAVPVQNNSQQMPLNAPPSPQQNSQPSAVDQVMQKYGIGGNGQQPQNQQNIQQNNQQSNAVDQVMQKYGLSNSVNPNSPSQQTGQYNQSGSGSSGHPLTSDALNFLTQKLKSGDKSVLYDLDGSYGDYQLKKQNDPRQPLYDSMLKRESNGNYQAQNQYGYAGGYQFGAQALEDAGLLKPGASQYGNRALDNPDNWTIDGGKDQFLNDPSIQQTAMETFTNKNLDRLKNAGIVNDNTPDNVINGYLAAAHLKGLGGAINLYNGIPTTDANGTSTADYFNTASNT